MAVASIEVSSSSRRHTSLQLFNIPSKLINKASFELIFDILLQYITIYEILLKDWKSNKSFRPKEKNRSERTNEQKKEKKEKTLATAGIFGTMEFLWH